MVNGYRNRSKYARYSRLFLVSALLVIIGLIEWYFASDYPVRSWLIVLALLLAITIAISDSVTGYRRGFLIDSRNKISLSRLQMVAWTLLVVSALLTAVFINVKIGWESPLGFDVPADLWMLMGISSASLVASPALLATKSGAVKDPDAMMGRLEQQGYKQLEADRMIVRYGSPELATWLDLFKGEELGNAPYLDFGRLQLFFFTFVALTAYAAALAGMFYDTLDQGAVMALPAIEGGLLTLIGISHTAYLANKMVPHTRTENGE